MNYGDVRRRLLGKYSGRRITRRINYELSTEVVAIDANESWTSEERDGLKQLIKQLSEGRL